MNVLNFNDREKMTYEYYYFSRGIKDFKPYETPKKSKYVEDVQKRIEEDLKRDREIREIMKDYCCSWEEAFKIYKEERG